MDTALHPSPRRPRKKRAAEQKLTVRDLSTRDQRKKRAPRDKPYFVDLDRGLAIGYRKGTDGASWVVREFKPDASHKWGGRYVQRRLGAADDTVPADGVSVLAWSDALAAAQSAERPTVTQPGRLTVTEAAGDYFATRTSTTPHDKVTWTAFIEPKLGNKAVSELTTGDFERWLAQQVPETDDKETLRAARATANRRWTVLRAILNSAYRKDPARVPSADAWRRVRPFQRVDRPRTRTLTAAEAQSLLGKLQEPLRALARGALETGLRLGELEALRAADIGPDFVRVRHSKAGLGKSRTVPLTKEGAAFFSKLAADKAPDAAVFGHVTRIAVSRQMRAASQAAKLDPPAVFHDLRRSYGSLLLNAGVAADSIQELLGHADLRMTRRAYAHLADASLQKAVRRLPSFTGKSRKVRTGSQKSR